ncbi:MAG: EVE domain-containing protein [SAR324 cluster bacterium]|uniref:EVE domain-containing protein n=1 Tax=SAR324 cluster bacterium TaxID=2024889 RepID=A0A7X9FR93_9DELT|nr:EVE domain-containing protein [SAR324 cluster bacterium]
MKYWLVKSDTADYSIDDFRKDKKTLWEGVRNYQARNFLVEMQIGDKVLFYQSVTEPIGVAGVGMVKKKAIADPTQFDKKSKYYDSSASKEKPRWFCPELLFKKQFKTVISLKSLRRRKRLNKMMLLKRGNRLSVMPVTEAEFLEIVGFEGCK